MDDVTLAGHAETVVVDIEMFRTKGTEMGLQLNVQKCELISANSSHSNIVSPKDFRQMDPTNSSFLDSPLLPGNAIENALEARGDDVDRAMFRLTLRRRGG